jgi:mRNA interferase RelE/StbE
LKIEALESFLIGVESVSNRKNRERIAKALEGIQAAENPFQIHNLKKLKGASSSFRISVGDYRIGLLIESDTVTLVRCLPRKDIYRVFP